MNYTMAQSPPRSNLYSASFSSLYQPTQTFTLRFITTLKGTTSTKFVELSTLIQEAIAANSKELQSCYTLLVENLFAFGNQAKEINLNLKTAATPGNVINQNHVYSFMHPEGPLFALIRHLMSDHLLRFEFPSTCLPPSSKLLIDEGITPHFYANRLSSDPISLCPTKVSLNALEYFLFHFAYFVTNQPMVNLNETTKTVTDNSLNQNLLEAYLLFFLPITSNKSRTTIDPQVPAQSLWKSLSSTTSNLLHLGSSEQSIVSQSQPAAKQKSLLLNLKPFNNQSFDSSANLLGTSMTHSRTIDPFGDLACKCETIITIFTEMWLNINVPASLQKKKQNSGQFVTPYCPSIDHMRYVRVLIKHLHYFANSVQEKQHDIMQMPAFEHNDLDDIKKSIWTSKFEIQKKLYSFFKLSFDRWPCDASFLMPLETWLSFIQPWRYMNGNARSTDDNKENGELEEQPSLLSTSGQTLAGAPIIDNRWKHFINDNLLFYTVIFRDLINRFIRIDLGSPKNSYMLFRVCKLFAQTNLTNLIKEVESQFENPNSTSWLASASLRGSLLSPSIRNASQSFRHNDSFVHLIEDTDEFEYHSFFSTHVREHMIRLLAEVQKVRNSKDFQPDPPTTSSASAGFFYSIWKSTFSSNENVDQEHEQLQLAELKRSLGYLDIVFDKFKALFEIDVQELDPSHLVTRTVTFAESVSDNVSFAGTLDTSTETPNERRLLRIRHNQSNVQFQGNPDLQPIRTYEIYYLVLLFQYLSSLINEYYGEQLIRLYYRTDLIGFVVKKLLSPPRDYIQVEKNGPKAERRLKRSLPPRVNLRPLASKALYVYLLSAAVVLFLYRLSGILLLILSFLSLVVILCYKLVESSPPETYGRSKWD